MAIRPKDILGFVVGRGRLRRTDDARRTTSGSPHTVGAPKAGEAGAPRSSTSSAKRKTAKRTGA
jgi:hypothetical protein